MRYLNSIKHAAKRTLRRFEPLRRLRRAIWPAPTIPFVNSEQYWKERYAKGGNSGEGSYGPLAEYKARFINDFCADKGISSAIEFGCGDGNQASKLHIAQYRGVDISEKCIAWARRKFRRDGWEFLTLDDYRASARNGGSELGLSLDVTYHLIEDEVYRSYLDDLFKAASRYVLVYSSNFDRFDPELPHVRHRTVVKDALDRRPEWRFVETASNPFHRAPDEQSYGSFAQFHIFERRAG
jgi:hypothetical protein